MHQSYNNFIIVLGLFIYVFLIYIFNLINIKDIKFLKKFSLYLCGIINIRKQIFWEVFKFIYFFIIGILPSIYFCIRSRMQIKYISSNINVLTSIAVFIIAFVAILEITFFVVIVVVEVLMGKNSRNELSKVSWIKFNNKYPIYTGIIRPIITALLETILFYGIFFYILNNICNFSIAICLILLAVLYTFSKILLVRNKEQALMYGTWAFMLNIVGGMLYIYSTSILLTLMLYMLYMFIIAFKE
ncbi:SagF family protein [Haloimpatiens sp. FM7330]|uniref:SagF family protein n=1 Tax=Haloimpatiens sp. FM7330 TaxID=3298610 RepID=UPI003642C55C